MGEMATLNRSGDTKLVWDADNEEEVKNARRTFDDLIKKGFAAFSVKKNGDQDRRISEFDRDAEKIILVPQMAGG